jgi:pimeloyl-ACP methyl ester carboxylesterase
VRTWGAASMTGFVLVVACLSGCGGTAGTGTSPPAKPVPAETLASRVGWYRMPAGDAALLTYSARGGLQLFSLWDTLYVRRFVPGPDGRLHVGRPDGPLVEFRERDGAVTGFAWAADPGETGMQSGEVRAERLRGYGYTAEPFAVRTEAATLAGTLFTPSERSGPVAAAVMIHGSGESDRDNYWYMIVADALVRGGVAVLLPDKRGSGLSGGDWFRAGLADFAADAAAQVEALRAHPAIDPRRVGVVGVSQGGRIAPLVDRLAAPAFVVNLSGAAVPLTEQLEHETRQDLKRDRLPGFLDFIVRPLTLWSVKRRRPEWWAENGPIDPVAAWADVRVPALTLYGREDERDNVPVARSVERLDSLALPNLEVRVFEGTGHGFFEPESARVRADVLEFLRQWVLNATAERS